MHAARRALWALTAAAAALPLAASGCGGGPHYEHAKVHGKVTYKGKPVPLGSVMFIPVTPPPDGSMQPASGTINADGTYELQSEADKGAMLGEHKVLVMAGQPASEPPAPAKTADVGGPPAPSRPVKGGRLKSLVPEKYSNPETTPLTKKVVAGDNTIDIELTD